MPCLPVFYGCFNVVNRYVSDSRMKDRFGRYIRCLVSHLVTGNVQNYSHHYNRYNIRIQRSGGFKYYPRVGIKMYPVLNLFIFNRAVYYYLYKNIA